MNLLATTVNVPSFYFNFQRVSSDSQFFILKTGNIFFLYLLTNPSNCLSILLIFQNQFLLLSVFSWKSKWQPTPVFLPGESQGWGAWWAAVYGVAQSDTTEVTQQQKQEFSPFSTPSISMLVLLPSLHLICTYFPAFIGDKSAIGYIQIYMDIFVYLFYKIHILAIIIPLVRTAFI